MAGRHLWARAIASTIDPEAATALQNRLAAARQARDLDGLRAVQADLGSLADVDMENGTSLTMVTSPVPVRARTSPPCTPSRVMSPVTPWKPFVSAIAFALACIAVAGIEGPSPPRSTAADARPDTRMAANIAATIT